ncbi:hypothetical protein L4C33_20845 [Vibrio makurazakiensis]|uniref:hypothetical protein n=1 Tax=Vibrio makurazakiensis TaxID=2910250 RepID=UPI003D1185D1
MNRILGNGFRAFLPFILAIFCGDLMANNSADKTLAELNAEERVQIRSWVSETSQPFVVNEQVIVNLEVMTDTWFTSGTRIHRIEMDDALVINNNALEVKDGKNKVKGSLTSAPLAFQVSKPSPRMVSSNKWITGSEAHVSEEWEVIRSERTGASTGVEGDDKLRVGDSIKRVVTTYVAGTSAMLLPDILEEPIHNRERISFYPHQAKSRDTEVRGEYRSQKVESATYILQESGELTFPSQTIYWWDTSSNIERKIILEEVKWQVSHTPYSLLKANITTVITIVLSMFIVIFTCLYVRKFYKNKPLPIWLRVFKSIRNRDVAKYESGLYESVLIESQRYRLLEGSEVNITISEIQRRYQLNKLEKPLSRVSLFFLYMKVRINNKHQENKIHR